MKRSITLIFYIVILVFCGCGQSFPIISAEDTGTENMISAIPSVSSAIVSPSSEIVRLPSGLKVFASEEELAGIKPLYEEYMSGNDMLAFAVSAMLSGETYLIGFIYENNDYTLPFSRVIGLTENGGSIEKAFVSDNYKNPEEWEPENLMLFMDESPFYYTKVFHIDGMLVVKTAETLSPESTINNFFLINEEGLLDNYINTNIDEACELYEYNGKLLFNGNYLWYDFNVEDKRIVLNQIKDFSQYSPDTDKGDFVIELKEYKPGSFAEESLKSNSYIELDIDSKTLKKKDFKAELEGDDWGVYYAYLSKRNFKIKTGTDIILLYPPGVEIDCYISPAMDDDMEDEDTDSGTDSKPLSMPGAVVLKAEQTGVYTVQISSESEVYQILITAK